MKSYRQCNDPLSFATQRPAETSVRSGFTLLELLIVISIIVVLLTMTAMTVRFSTEGDRVRGATRQIQSFLAGARDRAIYAKEPRGVRFFISPENPRAVTTMAYIAPGGTWSSPDNSAGVSLERIDGYLGVADGDFADAEDAVVRVHGKQNPGWWNLKRRGWLVDGLRIRIPKGPTGNWYPINTSLINTNVAPTPDQLADQFLLLQIPYADGGDNGKEIAHGELSYEIELPAKLLPQDPSILPESVVIDLDGSKIPSGWQLSSAAGSQYSGYMDIVFSPRGNIVGGSAGAGVIHLYVCDSEDSRYLKERFEAAWTTAPLPRPLPPPYHRDGLFVPLDEVPNTTWVGGDRNYLPKDRRIVSIFTQTGAVSVHQVSSFLLDATAAPNDSLDPLDLNNNANYNEADGLADDPYYFAETGKVAK